VDTLSGRSMPTPGPGEVIVKIGGAGACHSDLHLMHDFEPGMMPWKLPFTLGHENAGWADSVGYGVTTVSEDDAVVVYGAPVQKPIANMSAQVATPPSSSTASAITPDQSRCFKKSENR
jgi:NADPH:quinone reductase-like Zn-dependent oxidoreductase